MAKSGYRVSKDVLLNIAEHCDLQTVSNMMQTCKEIRDFLTFYEHSIAKAKIARFERPPAGLVLTSQDEERYIIPVRDSFTTVQELRRRAIRMDSILNNSGFLLIDEPETMGMPSREILEKFKIGLRDALHVTDRLADLTTDPSLYQVSDGEPEQLEAHESTDAPADLDSSAALAIASDDDAITAYNTQLAQQFRQVRRLRELQAAHIRALPSRDLAWLLTLGMGALRGYRRYSWELLKHDPGMGAARAMAFKEALLRGGLFFLWGFARGTGPLASFIRATVWQVAEEVLFYEAGVEIEGVKMSDGLHMTIVGELTRRMVEEKKREAESSGEVFDEEALNATAQPLWDEVNGIVAREIGWADWKGYEAVQHPADEYV